MASSWSDFLHLHGGHALPYADITAIHKALPSPRRAVTRKSGSNRVPGTLESFIGETERELLDMYGETNEPMCVAPMPLSWSEFQRVYGGEHGLSQRELLVLFERQRRAWTPIAAYPPPSPAPVEHPVSEPARQKTMTLGKLYEDVVASLSRAVVSGAQDKRPQATGQVAPAVPLTVPTPPPPLATVFGRPTNPQPRVRPLDQAQPRMLHASRALQIDENGIISPQQLTRVADFNGKDVSSEERAAHFKSLVAIVTNAASLDGRNTAEKSGITFRDTAEGRLFYDAFGKELSLEEVRAAQYQFTTRSAETTPFGDNSKIRLSQFTQVSEPKPKPRRTRRILHAVFPKQTQPEAVKNKHAFSSPDESIPCSKAVAHDLVEDELAAKYPPSTEHLPRVSFPFPRIPRSVRHHATATPISRTLRATHSPCGNMNNTKLTSTYPPSTERLPRVVLPTGLESHADYVAGLQNPRGNQRCEHATMASTIKLFAEYPPSTEHLPFPTTTFSSSSAHFLGPKEASVPDITPPFAAYPPSARSLPWGGLRDAAHSVSNGLFVAFKSLHLDNAATKSSPLKRVVDPELMLFPLISTIQREARGASNQNNEQDDSELPLDAAIKFGRELSAALSETYQAPRVVSVLTLEPQRNRPNLRDQGAKRHEHMDADDDNGTDDDTSDDRLELMPNHEYLTLTSSDGMHPVVGVLDNGEDVDVRVLERPAEAIETAFNDYIASLIYATSHDATVHVYGTVSLPGDKQVGIVSERLENWSPFSDAKYCGQVSDRQKLEKLIRIVDAIENLHASDVAHGDLKPEHVLVHDESNAVKLDRVGWTRLQTLVASSTYATLSGTFPDCFLHCTAAYAAPEVLQGEVSTNDTRAWMRSDVYALTVMVAETLLGCRPWQGESPMHMWNAVARRERRPFYVREIRVFGQTSPALQLLLSRGWHRDPAQRPTVTEVARGLRLVFGFFGER